MPGPLSPLSDGSGRPVGGTSRTRAPRGNEQRVTVLSIIAFVLVIVVVFFAAGYLFGRLVL
jgi:preprotein translocase subunit SecE